MKQLCSALGVDVIATGGSEEKLEVVKQQALGKGRSDSSAYRTVFIFVLYLYLYLYLYVGINCSQYVIPMLSSQSSRYTQLQQRREADCGSEGRCEEVKPTDCFNGILAY